MSAKSDSLDVHPSPEASSDPGAAPSAAARYADLQDRVVFITGGATGIGACLVEHFVDQGARVGFIDIAAEAGRALVAQLTPAARHAPFFLPTDITDTAALQVAIGRFRSAAGPITVLVNNAANDQRHSIEETTPEFWDQRIAVNLKHQFFAAQAVAPDMRKAGGGSIINFGSVSWKLKQGGMPVYTTSKAAVQGLTRSLARDLGPHGIRVNTLVPGWVLTERQIRLWLDDAGRADIARGQCLPTHLKPWHIARAALFLASTDSVMMTAQDLIIDGGWT